MGLEPVQGMWPVTATIAEEEGGPRCVSMATRKSRFGYMAIP